MEPIERQAIDIQINALRYYRDRNARWRNVWAIVAIINFFIVVYLILLRAYH